MLDFQWNHDHLETDLGFGKLDISGDETKGFRPFQLMVSSVAGCSAGVFTKILNKQRIDFDDLKIKADVERIEAEANRIAKITFTYTVVGKNLDEKKMQRNLELAKKHCSMLQSVKGSIEVEEKLILKEV